MLTNNPFTISPDPRYLYLTDGLAEAAEKVRYVVGQRQGLTVIYGDVGMGKSTLVRYVFGEYAARPDMRAVLIPTPDYDTSLQLLKAICDELGVPRRRSRLDQQVEFQEFLLTEYGEDRNVVVFLDEAQTLRGRVLELVRTLLNYETDQAKLIQIVLAGQLELRDRLRDKSKRALRSRIFTSSTLEPLTLEATGEMVGYRLERAGISNPFTPDGIAAVYRWTRGVPRDVMKVCGLALGLAAGGAVDARLVDRVAPDAEIDDVR